MQVSIVTSLFNRLDLTRPYLESLERTLRGWEYEVILVDDASTDGTREFLGGLSEPPYRVVLNDASRGFAANNNAGARLARAPLLCFLNNDVVLLPGWLEPMARLARFLPDVACVGNVQREPVSGLIDHYGFYFDAEGEAIHAGKNHSARPEEAYLSWPAVTAACWVLRRQVFLQLGGFDEKYRNGCEDLDFCLRAAAAGYRHFVANRSVIYHHISASPGRKRHDNQNLRLFRQRWHEQITTTLRLRKTAADLRAEGQRYLRKHLTHPWRYNLRRFCNALEKVCLPRPSSREPDLLAQAVFNLQDRFQRARQEPAEAAPSSPTFFLVVGNTVQTADCSGVPTLVRSLAGAFGRLGVAVQPVLWNATTRSLCLLPAELSLGLDAEGLRDPAVVPGTGIGAASLYDARMVSLHDPAAGGPSLHEVPRSTAALPGHWVLMPEVLYGKEEAVHLMHYIHERGGRLAVIFHDAIPVEAPGFAAPGQAVEHVAYMRFFNAADLILPVSETSGRDWEAFVAAHDLASAPLEVCTPGADTYSRARGTPTVREPSSPVRILCVSTVGARKNHRALLGAYDLATAARPDLTMELYLVGAVRPSMEPIPGAIHEAMARHPGKVHWFEQTDYSALRGFYERCDFTVYPSEVEGFGLPILESLWLGRPCICANFGAMAEAAAGGGCLTVEVRDTNALAAAILALAGSPDLRQRLGTEAGARRLKSWEEYATELLAHLG